MSIIGRLKFLKQTLTALSVTAPKEPLLLVLSINHQLRISDRMLWQKKKVRMALKEPLAASFLLSLP